MRNKNIQKATRLLKVLLFTLCCVFSANGYAEVKLTSVSQIEPDTYYYIIYHINDATSDTIKAGTIAGKIYPGSSSKQTGANLWKFEKVSTSTSSFYIKSGLGLYLSYKKEADGWTTSYKYYLYADKSKESFGVEWKSGSSEDESGGFCFHDYVDKKDLYLSYYPEGSKSVYRFFEKGNSKFDIVLPEVEIDGILYRLGTNEATVLQKNYQGDIEYLKPSLF